MNIAIISPEFPPFTNWGGIATFNLGLAQILSSLGYKVFVFTCNPSDTLRKIDNKDKFTVIYVPFKTENKIFNFIYYRIPFGVIRSFLKRFIPHLIFVIDWNVFSLLYFREYHKKYKFDAIHSPSYDFPAFLIRLFYKEPISYLYLQGLQSSINKYNRPNTDDRLLSLLEHKFIQFKTGRYIACSKNVKDYVSKLFPQLSENVSILPNFIDPNIYINYKKLNSNNLIHFGRLEYRKGVDLLIRAFATLARKDRNIKLFLIGDKKNNFLVRNTKVSFDQFLGTLKIPQNIFERIFVFPRFDQKETLIELLTNLKGIAVFPSRHEPFGLTTIEAMAMGFIVIASNKGGGKEIIKHGKNGFLTSPGQDEILNSLRQVRNLNSAEIKKITSSAIITVKEKYSYEKAKANIQKFLKPIHKTNTHIISGTEK